MILLEERQGRMEDSNSLYNLSKYSKLKSKVKSGGLYRQLSRYSALALFLSTILIGAANAQPNGTNSDQGSVNPSSSSSQDT